MKFHRVYIELTNICGLACSFCPPKTLPTHTMSTDFFESILVQLKPYTKELAYHIVGDPLVLSNLVTFLDMTHQHGFKVSITTSGYYLGKIELKTLCHPAIKQINISLNSYNKNTMPLSFEAYMQPIITLCHLKKELSPTIFINLRMWNLDDAHSEKTFNEIVFSYLNQAFSTFLSHPFSHTKSLRVDEKILLHFDHYFQWPTLESTALFDAPCQGLISHFGILSDGTLIPCCLDKDGIITLGNLHTHSLDELLKTPRVQAIRKGFFEGKAVELLCQKCLYKKRFKEKNDD